ncbi:MAG: TonB-dependent receptor [Polyangiaceae bacterium]|nr:TonB-dependent receptor [Polyangiaceae bacterium]
MTSFRLRVLCGAGLFALALGFTRSAFAQPVAQPGGARVGDRDATARVIKPPRIVKFVEAEYPPSEKETSKEATVVLSLGISETGAVVAVVVQESAGPAFDVAAVAAARQFIFEPAEVNGKLIPVKITYRYEFVIKHEMIKRSNSDFQGEVRDRTTKKPLSDVTVTLETGQHATTDAQGHFTIAEVTPGDHTVTLSGEGLTPTSTQETFEAGKKLDATYDVEIKANVPGDDDSDFEVVVTAPRIGRQVVSTEIPAEQGRKVPGTQGDVLKVVENLPGVARSAVGSGALVVWGAAPEDTQVFVEGIRIPRLYHDGGYRSVIHSDMVKSVELVPGGYGASYGRGIGGLVNVQLRPIPQDRVHGSVNVDIIDASASVSAPITDKLSAAVAFRRSHLDSVVKAVGSGDVADVVPLPKYYDGQARIVYQFNANETFELGGLLSSDNTDHTLLGADPADTKRESQALAFGRVYGRYEKKLPTGDTIVLTPSWGKNHSRITDRFGTTPTELTSDANVFGFRGTYRAQPEKWLGVSFGVDIDVMSSAFRRAGSVSSPAREGDVRVFGQAPSDQVNVDRWHSVVSSFAPFAEADVGLFDDKLHIVPGLRLEPYIIAVDKVTPVSGDVPPVGTTSEKTALEPRIAIRYQFSPRLTAKAAFGFYHQPPAGEDLSAVFGNPKLGLESAIHSLVGTAVKITDTLNAEVTAFYSGMSDLVSRSTAPTPLLAQALVQQGTGKSYGAQLLLRQEQIGRFFGWASYSLIRSVRTDAPGLDERLFDYDQTHVLTIVGSYDLGKGFEVGARCRYATGYPRTPVVGSFYSPRTDRFEPIFGRQNSERIPAFRQLDARIAKRFKIGATDAEVYLDVQNVTNHANAEEIVYSYDYKQKAYIKGLPTLPVLGFKWTF